MSANREAAGYLPSQVTLRLIGDMTRADLIEVFHEAGYGAYVDCTDTLCVMSPERLAAHKETLRVERQARLNHAQRHAELVKADGDRNRANGYRSPDLLTKLAEKQS